MEMDDFTKDMMERAIRRREKLEKSAQVPSKRPCLRAEENQIKPDTPAIKSVKSRLQNLSAQRAAWDNQENAIPMDTDDVPSPHRAPEPALSDTRTPVEKNGGSPRRKSYGRRTKLAALAQQINSYDDDLSHPTVKKEDKTSRTWQPPKPDSPAKLEGPNKPPRTYEHSPVKESIKSPGPKSPIKSVASPVKSFSQETQSPTKATPTKLEQSPVKRTNQTPVKSSPVKLNSPIKNLQQSPLKKSEASSREIKSSTGESSSVQTSEVVLRKPKSKASSVKQAASTAKASPSGEAEPTKRPVSARLAAWQEKVNAVFEEANDQTAVIPRPPGIKTQNQGSVKNRWQKPASDNTNTTVPKSPTKQPQSPTKQPQSPTKSPVKNLGVSTKTMHENLSTVQDKWRGNEINEKTQMERKAELDALNNRWKKKEDSNRNEKEVTEEKSAFIMNGNSSVPCSEPKMSGSSIKKTSNAENTPVKLRAEEQMETEDTTEVSKSTDDTNPNFENNLKAMGFEVNSVTDLGHVATLDLTPQRQRDAALKKQQASLTSPTKSSPKKKASVTANHQKAEPTLSSPTKTQVNMPAAAASGGGRSLYSLIKTCKTTPAASTSSQAVPDVASRAAPAPVKPTDDVNMDDEDDDSFDDDVSEADMETKPVMSMRPVSQTSLDSQYSEFTESSLSTQDDYDDTVTTEQDDITTQDDDDDYDDDDDDDDYTDSSGEESGEGVDDLLDEALEDSFVPPAKNTVPPHHSPVKPQQSSRPVESDDVLRRVRWASGTQRGMSPVTSCQTTSATEMESDDGSVAYSIDQYRQQNMDKRKSSCDATRIVVKQQKSPPKKKEPVPQPRHQVDLKKKLQELQERVNQEQNVIMQTSNALNQCCGSNSSFAGSQEAVECHRLLLIACRKREAYLTEMQYLREGRSISQRNNGPQGSLTIEGIRLPLKHEFMSALGTARDTTVHYFLVMLRHGGKVVFTEMVSTHNAVVRGSLHFQNFIKLSDIAQDFKVDLEVYGMSVTREPVNTPKKKRGLTPKKASSASKRIAMASPGGPLAVRTTNFTLLASQSLTMPSVDKTSFNLERLPISSPLQGSIHLKLHCLMEADVELSGFLTMFEDVSGFGAWHRRWCVLKSNLLSFWKYPDEEHTKEPIGSIDLKTCITDVVGLIARDICARPNSFELRSVRRQYRGERDTLVSKCYNTMTTTKHWLSADTKEERIMWCNHLNEALHSVRAWHPEALRPLKPVKSTNPYPSESNI